MIVLTILYLFVLAYNVYANIVQKRVLAAVFKVALMPLLLVVYNLSPVHVSYFVIAALVFSLLGDVFLIFSKKYNIILGICSFALAHIFYMIKLNDIFVKTPAISTIAIVAAIFLIVTLPVLCFMAINSKQKLGKFYILTLMYGALLVLLNIYACNLYIVNNNLPSFVMLVGSLLFLISDTVLSFSLFIKKYKLSEAVIMTTYGLAQLFIVYGIIYNMNL